MTTGAESVDLLRSDARPRFWGVEWKPVDKSGSALSGSQRTDRTTEGKETARMAAKEGYCVKCKAKKEIKDPQEITMKNGRPATQGTCPDCGTKIFKIGKS